MQFSSFKGLPQRLAKGLTAAVLIAGLASPALAVSTFKEPHAPAHGFSFESPIGTHNQAQLQRGYKVYREVCSSCHAMHLVHFRDLAVKGGPFWDPKYPNPTDNPVVKEIASEYQVDDVDTTTGDPIKRKGIPADPLPSPYPNAYAAAAANGGAVPPDQSDLAKAREGGARYIYSLLSGYVANPPKDLHVGAKYYNPYMPGDLSSFWTGKGAAPEGGLIAMPPPLKPGLVKFDDGKPSTVDQEAQDVAAFLDWASDPHATDRKQMGFSVMIYLLLLAGVSYLSYRAIWRNVSH